MSFFASSTRGIIMSKRMPVSSLIRRLYVFMKKLKLADFYQRICTRDVVIYILLRVGHLSGKAICVYGCCMVTDCMQEPTFQRYRMTH